MKGEDCLLDILPLVRKPSRYVDREKNACRKDPSESFLKVCLAFPDTYEVGISHLGLQILYSILNSHPRIFCDRVYAPWVDMEGVLRERDIPLLSIERALPLRDFDIIGFSLQYELSATNILAILDLSGIPFFAEERTDPFPLIIGGGPMAYNPEPLAPFFDAFCIGDGEELILDVAEKVMEGKEKGWEKKRVLEELSSIEGVYVPSFFEVTYRRDGRIEEIRPLLKGYEVKRRIVRDLETAFFPTDPIVPYAQAIHDRLTVEIQRGCTRGCRFCHAGMVYRPVRERSPSRILEIVRKSLKDTGYDEVSLLSLSTGDYAAIEDLTVRLMEELKERKVALSFPSLRVGSVTPSFIEKVKEVRRTGFTFAPEAGTARLRAVINKEMDEEELYRATELLFSAGWRSVKLYFMIGLPTERDEDLEGIVDMARKVLRTGKGRKTTVKLAISTFVPKPHTPFQWTSMIPVEEILRRQAFIRKRLGKGFEVKVHDARMSLLEGVFSRGDRRLAPVIVRAYRLGSRFDGWKEEFDFQRWQEAFKEEGLDISFYALREREREEILPWDHIGGFISKPFLWREYEKALEGKVSEDCKVGRCEGCGICDFKEIKNIVFHEKVKGEAPFEISRRPLLPVKGRLRVNFTKRGMMRFLSHLELINLFYRALRRAEFPLLYSGGYHPLPKVSFGEPLPVGMESLDEHLDIEVEGMPDLRSLLQRLGKELPEGIEPLGISFVPPETPLLTPPLGATYRIGPFEDVEEIKKKIDSLLSGKTPIEKKGKEVYPLVRDFKVDDGHLYLTLLKGEVGIKDLVNFLFPSPSAWLKVCKVKTLLREEKAFQPILSIKR